MSHCEKWAHTLLLVLDTASVEKRTQLLTDLSREISVSSEPAEHDPPSEDDFKQLLRYLSWTASRFVDRPSRSAIVDIFKLLQATFPDTFTVAAARTLLSITEANCGKADQINTNKKYKCPLSERFVLLTWATALIDSIASASSATQDLRITAIPSTIASPSLESAPKLRDLTSCQAILLDSILSESAVDQDQRAAAQLSGESHAPPPNQQIIRSALRLVRRSIRTRAELLVPVYFRLLMPGAHTSNTTLLFSPNQTAAYALLGVTVDVVLHIKPDARGTLLELKERITATDSKWAAMLAEWYATSIFASPSGYVASALAPLGKLLTNGDLVEKTIVPSASRLLLRSPDAMLRMIPSMASNIAAGAGQLASSNDILKALLGTLKSSDQRTRGSAAEAFVALVKFSDKPEHIRQTIEEFRKLLAVDKSLDSKTVTYKALSLLAQGMDGRVADLSTSNEWADVTAAALNVVIEMLPKETNDGAIVALCEALTAFTVILTRFESSTTITVDLRPVSALPLATSPKLAKAKAAVPAKTSTAKSVSSSTTGASALEICLSVYLEHLTNHMAATGINVKQTVRKAWVVALGKVILRDTLSPVLCEGGDNNSRLRNGVAHVLRSAEFKSISGSLETLVSGPSTPAVISEPIASGKGASAKGARTSAGKKPSVAVETSKNATLGSTAPINDSTSAIQIIAKLIELLAKVLSNSKEFTSGGGASGLGAGAAIEGYVAIAILQQTSIIVDGISQFLSSKNLSSALLTVTAPVTAAKKPLGSGSVPISFLLNEKVYGKLTSPEEYQWFCLALTSVLEGCDDTNDKSQTGKSFFRTALVVDSPAAVAVVSAWIAGISNKLTIAFGNQSKTVGTFFNDALSTLVSKSDLGIHRWSWLNDLFREGVRSWLSDPSTSLSTDKKSASSVPSADLFNMVRAITTVPEADSGSVEVIEECIVSWAPIVCHPALSSKRNIFSWITLAQNARVDPGDVAGTYSERFLALITDDVVGLNSKEFSTAAVNLAAILAFVSPTIMLPKITDLALKDLDSKMLHGIGQTEIEIWKTDEGQLFVDVLKRSAVVEDRNRKNYETDKWEADLRKELAAKGKSAAQKLTKEEQAAVDAQKAKERLIRQRVQNCSVILDRGLSVLRSLIRGNSEAIASSGRVTELARVVLEIATRGGGLVGVKAVDTFIDLGGCAQRFEDIREPLAMATLRARNVTQVPERWCSETVAVLVTRVLYKVRYISEFQPTPPSTFGYVFPLLEQIILEGGVGHGITTSKEVMEDIMEQISVATDIIGFHCANGSSTTMPRQEMINCLLRVIGEYPQFAKTARASLVHLCEKIDDSASLTEVDVLFEKLLSAEPLVRSAALQALDTLDLPDIRFSRELWMATFDENAESAEMAQRLWEENGMEVSGDYCSGLLDLVVHDHYNVRLSAAKALATAVSLHPETIDATLRDIYLMYADKAVLPVPEYDMFGMVVAESLERKDAAEARAGLAKALKQLAPYFTSSDLGLFFEFLIDKHALGDRSEDVRQRMLDAGMEVIAEHGAENIYDIMPSLENYLGKPAPPSEVHDRIRESVVILFGAIAGHLPVGDPKIQAAVDKLIETLETPSEAVQAAVADCLPRLIKSIKDDAPKLIDQLLDQAFTSSSYAVRRGAAYGLAGTVKGRGISALKECNVMNRLKEKVEDKKSYEGRQGAIFCFETLSQSLGRLFEPYVIQILPLMLVCFGDSTVEVREATSDAARVIMSKISGHCVKLILPSLLAGLEDGRWRTKAGSVELLGSMAFCAPKQLSVSLPTIVPRIADVLADSHQSVQKAARVALTYFGDVINNPEIQELVPTLMKAICDPNKQTSVALSALLDTAFVHYIDAPSLALIAPILERGLRERSFDVKKKSAQIMGNMASLTDQKDLTPYLPKLLPRLKEVLTDPVPEARATAAKALGTMVEKLGEQNFPDLVQELVQTLKSDTSSADRAGAAQGLSEVLAGVGVERLEGLFPEILLNTNNSKSYVREGFLSLLIYLPSTFGVRFQPYLGRIIPPILRGLADESEFVREASLRAGQMIVRNYATRAVDLLLPELEKGLFDVNWRIRQSSVQLMGDLLFRITGVSGKAQADDDEEAAGTEAGRKALLDVLGETKRNGVLAALYIVRSDVSAIVRQASITVWKSVVTNTPRTLKEVLPVMMHLVIGSLADANYDRRQVAARTLGDIVRKLGDGILVDLMPILERGLDDDEPDTRQGACVGLREIMMTASKQVIQNHVDRIVPAVRRGLCDSDPDVREAAAQAFDALHQHLGNKAIDDILPVLLSALQDGDESSNALEALKEVMAVRSNVVFPVLIPTLIATPISSFNARALSALVKVAGVALTKRLTMILQALMESLEQDADTVADVHETIRVVLLSVDDGDGVYTLMGMLFDAVKDPQSLRRAGACDILATFIAETEADYERYINDWLRTLIEMFNDSNSSVVEAAWKALQSLTSKFRKDDMEGYVGTIRKAIRKATEDLNDEDELPGFCINRGIGPVLPIFLQGLTAGSTGSREQSALALGELVQRTSPAALKPFVTQMTGPLIRVIGDRYPGEVKAAILQTLCSLLQKVPLLLKPFLPQLQRTFVKSLSDSASSVRSRASAALSVLITQPIRVDPLVTELLTAVKANEGEVQEANMTALENVLKLVGSSMNDTTKKAVEETIQAGFGDENPTVQRAAASCLSAYLKCVSPQDVVLLLSDMIYVSETASSTQQNASLVALQAVLANSPECLEPIGKVSETVSKVVAAAKPEETEELAILCAGRLLVLETYQTKESISPLVTTIANTIKSKETTPEAKRAALVVVKHVAKLYPELLKEYIPILAPPTLVCVRDRDVSVKLAGERCLLHLFCLMDGDSVFQNFVKSLDAPLAKTYTDYHKRVLAKLVISDAVSDDEGLDALAGDGDGDGGDDVYD